MFSMLDSVNYNYVMLNFKKHTIVSNPQSILRGKIGQAFDISL